MPRLATRHFRIHGLVFRAQTDEEADEFESDGDEVHTQLPTLNSLFVPSSDILSASPSALSGSLAGRTHQPTTQSSHGYHEEPRFEPLPNYTVKPPRKHCRTYSAFSALCRICHRQFQIQSRRDGCSKVSSMKPKQRARDIGALSQPAVKSRRLVQSRSYCVQVGKTS